jgi:hypothetical protein
MVALIHDERTLPTLAGGNSERRTQPVRWQNADRLVAFRREAGSQLAQRTPAALGLLARHESGSPNLIERTPLLVP